MDLSLPCVLFSGTRYRLARWPATVGGGRSSLGRAGLLWSFGAPWTLGGMALCTRAFPAAVLSTRGAPTRHPVSLLSYCEAVTVVPSLPCPPSPARWHTGLERSEEGAVPALAGYVCDVR